MPERDRVFRYADQAVGVEQGSVVLFRGVFFHGAAVARSSGEDQEAERGQQQAEAEHHRSQGDEHGPAGDEPVDDEHHSGYLKEKSGKRKEPGQCNPGRGNGVLRA